MSTRYNQEAYRQQKRARRIEDCKKNLPEHGPWPATAPPGSAEELGRPLRDDPRDAPPAGSGPAGW
jgi:hypothetical protein